MTRLTTALSAAKASARPRVAAAGAVTLAGALLLTGCGDQTDGAKSGGKYDESAPLAKLLPDEIRSEGVLKVGSDINYAPVEFKDKTGKTVGIDVDLAAAMGKKLGVEFRFQNSTFDTILGGLRSGRYDIAMSAMTDTKNRQNAIDEETGKSVGTGFDFVDYFSAGVSMYTRKGDTQDIKDWSDLCGKTVALQRGTVSHDLAKAEAKKCGAKKMKIESFDNDQQAQTRLRAGGADAGTSDFPVAAYAVAKSGGGDDFEIVGDQVDAAPYGIAVSKKDKELTNALKTALDAVIDDGTYAKILKKWGVEDGTVTKAVINGGK